MLKVSFAADVIPGQNALILTVADKGKLGEQGRKLDKKLNGSVTRAIAASHFTGVASQTLTILAPAKTRLSRLVLVGIGDPAKADAALFARVGGAAVTALNGKDSQAVFLVDAFKGLAVPVAEAAAQAGLGARLRSYRFDKYHTKLKPAQKPALKHLIVASNAVADAKALYAPLDKIADGVCLTRDLVTEPANILYPETLAQHAHALAELGVKVDILDEKQMKKLGMGALLGVAQGSVHAPRLVTMEWRGDAQSKQAPVCFVGKGVTFDSGGYSLKTGVGMEEMKFDMAGAGAVIGAIKALAGRKAKANVVGVIGLVENMVSGNAQRPGDVVTSASGQTIEILNTDAEGRLVLADALWYAQDKFKPRCIVDLATLTGAIITAVGYEYAGLFGNDDNLSEQLTQAGKKVEENLWRFPMGDVFDKMINSPIADMKNIGERGAAGSVTAAQFLQRFIKKGMAWAHLDIAGTAWVPKDRPLSPKGATAFGVRLLDRFIADNFEVK